MFCDDFNIVPRNKNVNPNAVMISGVSISPAMLGVLNFITDGPWWSVFHHSTEKCIIGIFIKPTIAKIFTDVEAFLLSSKEPCSNKIEIYIKILVRIYFRFEIYDWRDHNIRFLPNLML